MLDTVLTATYYLALGAALICAVGLGFLWGRWDRHRGTRIHFNRRRFARREEEQIMASLARLEAAVTATLAELARLKAGQEDPATQAKADELAAALESAVAPSPPA